MKFYRSGLPFFFNFKNNLATHNLGNITSRRNIIYSTNKHCLFEPAYYNKVQLFYNPQCTRKDYSTLLVTCRTVKEVCQLKWRSCLLLCYRAILEIRVCFLNLCVETISSIKNFWKHVHQLLILDKHFTLYFLKQTKYTFVFLRRLL